MAERARECGVALVTGCEIRDPAIDADGVTLQANGLALRARLLVAADGLHSPLRRAAGLEVPHRGPIRFGVRQHFAIPPWGARVEVHFAAGAEAYVTPAGAKRIGVAFLWEDGALGEKAGFANLLARFPAIAARLDGAAVDSAPRGAGPLRHDVRVRVRDRFVLLGDAAGYVDAITGEGLSLAFTSAAALAELLPKALDEGAMAASLAPYARAVASAFTDYARSAKALVWMARHPRLRRMAIDRLIAHPWLFERALRAAVTPRHA
jgi:flavin-dependent dehydrogenase